MSPQASTGTKSLRAPSRDRITQLTAVVSIACNMSVDEILEPKNTAKVTHARARTLLMSLAHDHQIIDDGRLQDYLECSQKNIRDACTAVANDPELKRTADAIWSTFSGDESVKKNCALRPAVTLGSLSVVLARAFKISWAEVKMFGNISGRSSSTMALQAIVIIGRDVLQKDFAAISRITGRGESELVRLYKSTQIDMEARPDLIFPSDLRKTVIKVCDELHLEHSWK